MKCPCGSGDEYGDCCEPYIRKQQHPETAEQCMRSRFTAYALGQVDYLVYSHAPATRSAKLREAIREWARKAEFRTLRIIETQSGDSAANDGIVHFEADYIEEGQSKTLAERSVFGRHDGRWVYEKGTAPRTATVTRDTAKIGRNDPCVCGSGKKYKKCCLNRQ